VARPSLRSAIPWILLALIVAFVGWKLKASHFDWAGFAASWRTADWRLIALSALVIQINYFVRAMRWAVFLRPAYRAAGTKALGWWPLVGSQYVGFTGLCIFGRIGELIRPLLISRKTGLSFSSQIAVVAVERVFDLGAFGLIFSLNLLFAPQVQSLPYLHKAGYTIGTLTVVLGVFVAVVRLAGETVARLSERLVGLASKNAATAVGDKIRAFRDGLNVIDGIKDLLLTAALSLFMWATIALSYLIALKAFPAPVHGLTFSHTIVLMGFSIAGSALPIPGGGGAWAGNVFALTNLFHIPAALAASSGLMVWLVTNMTVIPLGLLFARVEGVSIRQVTRRSEAAEDAVAAGSNPI
jgi:uncharacterized protein (TIRG00374 family)